jgi:GNAT superfamily N-acetyltransferase
VLQARFSPRCNRVSEVQVSTASGADVAAIAARRSFDERAFRLSAAFAQAGNAWSARDETETIGLALAHVTPDERYVGDLFVEPSFRNAGIGARLLDAALEDGGSGASRTIMLEAGDAAGVALALRRRISVRTPVLRLAGPIPREDTLVEMAAGDYRFEIEAIDPARHGFSLDALDRETRGAARPLEHVRFVEAAHGSAIFRNDEFVAYSYVWPDGRIGPVAAVSAVYLVQVLALSFVTLQRQFDASWCSAYVPATNVRLARAALRSGLRIAGANLFASDSSEADLSRYAGFHPLLF